MKIINEKAAYVQKKDIALLRKVWNYDDTVLPFSIFVRFISNKSTIGNNEKNKLDFIMFKNEDEIEFFRSLAWIFDYDKLNELNGEEIQNIYFKLRNKKITLDYAINEKLNGDESKYTSAHLKRDILNHMMTELDNLSKSEKRIPKSITENKVKRIERTIVNRISRKY